MVTLGRPTVRSFDEWIHREDHPSWYGRFSDRQRQQMIDDDMSFGLTVPILMVSVMAVGVVLAVLTVMAAW